MGTHQVLETCAFDQSYVLRLSAGDPETEGHFATHFGGLLKLRLRTRHRDLNSADDVTQETLFRVLRAIRSDPASIEHPERLGPYVNSVCTNVMHEGFRGEMRYQPTTDAKLDRADPAMDVERSMLSAERQAMVRRLLSEMSLQDRSLLTELFLEERDKDEICAAHSVDRDYLRVLLFRARNRFRLLLCEKS
jgi:RNA polymerase sigma-70 factor, ECF subfamily